jgi:hypothetical protein
MIARSTRLTRNTLRRVLTWAPRSTRALHAPAAGPTRSSAASDALAEERAAARAHVGAALDASAALDHDTPVEEHAAARVYVSASLDVGVDSATMHPPRWT